MVVVTILKIQQVKTLVEKGRIDSVYCLAEVSETFQQYINEYIKNNVGYICNSVSGFSKVSGQCGRLETMWGNITAIGDICTNCFVMELDIPDDMLISIDFYKYLNLIEDCDDIKTDLDLELFKEDFKDYITLGPGQEDTVISFIPFIDLKYCKRYFIVDEDWETSQQSTPKSVTDLKYEKLELFA